MSAGDDILPRESIVAITGYKRPSDQLAELRAQGFYRARQSSNHRRNHPGADIRASASTSTSPPGGLTWSPNPTMWPSALVNCPVPP